jgi:protein phosphatase 1 regulatory subunit 7
MALAKSCVVGQGLGKFANLRVLDLGSNRIRSMDGLEGCSGLVELWLGRNRISQISHVEQYAG